MTPPKTEFIQIRIEPELKEEAKKLADKEGRTLSNWVVWLIQNEISKESQ
ncbi:MAG: YlcI/YnfO family protein [Candidatus Thiodiazotropha taylori]